MCVQSVSCHSSSPRLLLHTFYSLEAPEGPSSFLFRSMLLEIPGIFLLLILEDPCKSLMSVAVVPSDYSGTTWIILYYYLDHQYLELPQDKKNLSLVNLDCFHNIILLKYSVSKVSVSLLCLPAGGYMHRTVFPKLCFLQSVFCGIAVLGGICILTHQLVIS